MPKSKRHIKRRQKAAGHVKARNVARNNRRKPLQIHGMTIDHLKGQQPMKIDYINELD